jgi:hypothetical protein
VIEEPNAIIVHAGGGGECSRRSLGFRGPMDVAHYSVGVLLGVVCIGSIAVGARRLRTRLLAEWTGAPAWVAEGVIVAALIVLALELVGILGALTRLGVVLGCVAAGLAAWVAAGRIARPARVVGIRVGGKAEAVGGEASAAGLPRIAAAAACAVVAAPWLGWTIYAYRHGIQTVDSLWYHLPAAARFVQLGNILHLQYFDRDPVTVFYPANSELFHALGLLLFRSDLLSPMINLAWAGLGLGAAWSIGRPFGRAPHCLVAGALVLATPGLIDTQPGGAYNDITCLALVLASAALLVTGSSAGGSDVPEGGVISSPASALAAAAAGLALGTKFTMIVPAAALGVGVASIAPRGSRAHHTLIWVVGLLLLGGYWYLRNAITAGNPLPSLAIHLGPLSLPAPHVTTPTYTVAQYLTDLHIWRLVFVPGLRQSLGLAWWALIAAAAAGAIGALLGGPERVLRMLGAVAILSGISFVVTRQFLGIPGIPIFFVANVRYATPALALGLALMPIIPPLRRRERPALVWLGVALVALLFTELDPGVWPTGLGLTPFARPIHGSAAIAGAVLAALIFAAWLVRGRLAGASRRMAPAVVVAAALGGWFVADSYAKKRYTNTQPLPSIYAWAQRVRHARIAVVGVDLQYPLYGPDGSNYVQYVGAHAQHAGFGSITSCSAWRAAIGRGHYRWVLVTPFGFPLGTSSTVAPEAAWTGSSAGARPVLREANDMGEQAVLYRITAPLDPRAC